MLAPRFVRTIRSLDRLGAAEAGLGAREKSAISRSRFSPAQRSPASMRSCVKTHPGPAPGVAASPCAPRPPASRAPAATRTRRRCATRSTSLAPAPILDPRDRRLLVWRALAAGSAGQWRSAIVVAAAALDVHAPEGLPQAIDAAEACAEGHRPAPFAAARAHELARRALTPPAGRGGAAESELLAAWLADSVLAQKLHWPFALPLLAGPMVSAAGPRAAGNAVDGDATTRLLFGYGEGAAHACDLAAELRRRAQTLATAAPELRAKGAKTALQALLDASSASRSRG